MMTDKDNYPEHHELVSGIIESIRNASLADRLWVCNMGMFMSTSEFESQEGKTEYMRRVQRRECSIDMMPVFTFGLFCVTPEDPDRCTQNDMKDITDLRHMCFYKNITLTDAMLTYMHKNINNAVMLTLDNESTKLDKFSWVPQVSDVAACLFMHTLSSPISDDRMNLATLAPS